jgi:integrase
LEGHFGGLYGVMARVCKIADLKGVTPHVLRHSYASIAAELGYSELTIAGLLGHAAGSVTAGYVHLDQALVTAADRVSAVIADALGSSRLTVRRRSSAGRKPTCGVSLPICRRLAHPRRTSARPLA